MPNNVGPYVSVAKLLSELPAANKATKQNLVLTNKAVISGTETEYDFAPASPAPAPFDYLTQGEFHQVITQVTGNKLRVADGTNIANGQARAVKTDYTEPELQELILSAMSFIDRHTRQWFNERTFDDAAPLRLEGNNSEVLFLPVPIIEVTSIKKQEGGEVLSPTFYQVFNSRSLPDDRKNPMIKLRQEDDDVLFMSSGKWMRGVRAVITGKFGYLEADGSTPRMIQRACLKLALIYASQSLGAAANQSATSGEVGPIKREKTDMHEVEYYDSRAGSKSGTSEGTGLSGDDEIDDIIAAYKGPILIGGTFPDIGIEAPVIASWTRG